MKKNVNDLKKGDRVFMRSGWYGTIADNLKGITRLVDVEGDYRELGSVYSWDILEYITPSGDLIAVEIPQPHLKKKEAIFNALGWGSIST